MLHIIKTGGESLETYLNGQPSPNLDFSTCRKSAMTTGWTANMSASPACLAGATVVSSALCGLNCECCAADVRLPPGEVRALTVLYCALPYTNCARTVPYPTLPVPYLHYAFCILH